MDAEDEGIRATREVRRKISEECGHDPTSLVERYIREQERHHERLLPVSAPNILMQTDGASRRS